MKKLTVNQFSKIKDIWKVAILAKMAINRQNCQIVNKNSNEMAKGALLKVVILAEMAINRHGVQSYKYI